MQKDCIDIIFIGMDGSYKVKGQGVSACVVQHNNITTTSCTQLVAAHSSYDTEMQAVHMAIEYIHENCTGKVIIFIDNQSMLRSIFNVKPHSLFELSRQNSITIGNWIRSSSDNNIEFCWMPSHLGFTINELADSAADSTPIGPFPAPNPTITSRIHSNKANVVIEWCTSWAAFARTKDLVLKKKKKAVLPNVWDGKSKAFMLLAQDMPQFSRFT